MNLMTAQSYLKNKYHVSTMKKKLVHVYLDDWMIDELKKIQKAYKVETGNTVPLSRIIRSAILDHTGKTIKTLKSIKTMQKKYNS